MKPGFSQLEHRVMIIVTGEIMKILDIKLKLDIFDVATLDEIQVIKGEYDDK